MDFFVITVFSAIRYISKEGGRTSPGFQEKKGRGQNVRFKEKVSKLFGRMGGSGGRGEELTSPWLER